MSEALIFASTNSQYDNRFFIQFLLSYCGLVDARINASEKYLPVPTKIENLFFKF